LVILDIAGDLRACFLSLTSSILSSLLVLSLLGKIKLFILSSASLRVVSRSLNQSDTLELGL